VTPVAEARRRRGDWHCHTDYTDGASSVDDYCRTARANGLDLLVFSEHVRRELDYDFDAFCADVEAARERYDDLTLLVGCEAKALDSDGTLDVSEAVLDRVDVVTGVFHRFPEVTAEAYVAAATALVSNPVVDVFGHPTLLPTRRGLDVTPEQWTPVAAAARDNDVAVEVNARYDLPRAAIVAATGETGATFVVGSDAHVARELQTQETLQERWTWIHEQY
jgi:histidinol phosphatase-like PHP family hydrolase